MGPLALLLGAVLSVGGTVGAISAQNRAARLQQRQEQLTTQRNRRQAIREFQIQRAQATAGAVASGAGGGSGMAGGIGGLSSQLGSDLGFGTQMSGLSSNINRASRAANFYSGLATVGGGLFNYSVNMGADPSSLFSGFNRPPTPTPLPSSVPYPPTRPRNL